MAGSSSVSSSEDDWDVTPEVAVIKEIYDDRNPYENFEIELERALTAGFPTIVIEPSKLGDETSRWISVGNCLHKTAVLSGFGSIIAECLWPDRAYTYWPLVGVSVICTGLYTISWQFDPCCKYQIETDVNKLSKLPSQSLSSMSPVVLVRKDDSRRKILHSTITLLALSLCSWNIYCKFIK
ncbi:TMEM11 (predicted) [Pycnogonum litorale]